MNKTLGANSGHLEDAIEQAVIALKEGELVILPTETVYGLGADATNGEAVARIFDAKGRPSFNPLIAHVTDLEMAESLVQFDPISKKLAQKFWPGPLTLVLPILENSNVSELVTAGLGTLAIRMPKHPIAQALLGKFQGPIAAPSANISGMLSPTNMGDLDPRIESKVAAILDGGPCDIGLESTIIMVKDGKPHLLREGGISKDMLEKDLNEPVVLEFNPESPSSPGQLLAHYAPRARLRINVKTSNENSFHIGFGADKGDLNLSPSGDLIEAAANLFAYLHEADRKVESSGIEEITVTLIPDIGIGRAINDRLRRAAHGSA